MSDGAPSGPGLILLGVLMILSGNGLHSWPIPVVVAGALALLGWATILAGMAAGHFKRRTENDA